MALFGMGNKKEAAPGGSPLEQIHQMRQQGLSNNQIVETLQKQGYRSNEIFDAMSQADTPGNIELPPPEGEPAQPAQTRPTSEEPMQEASPSYDYTPETSAPYVDDRIEELVEAIIDEKWAEIVKNINKVIEWKAKVEGQVLSIEQEIKDLKTDFEELHKAVIGKISEYDQNITKVGVELKAMGQVFEKVLPTFTENVNELSRITTVMKRKKQA